MEVLVKKETIGEKLGISVATVNNWIKTQVIPSPDLNNYYTQKSFEYIINSINDNPSRLNSRANRTMLDKKDLCYLGITDKNRQSLLFKIVGIFENSKLSTGEGVLALSFAILRSNRFIDKNWQMNNTSKLDVFLTDWISKSPNKDKIINLFLQYDVPNLNDDILGAFYQSIQNISQKSNTGSYYTPPELLNEIKVPLNKTVLDPCCGSGGILLNVLSKDHDPSKIFARDIDKIALKICCINLILFFNDKNIAPNIENKDITLNNTQDLFFPDKKEKFDYIITNPPWGSKFTTQQKEYLCKTYPELATPEIFSISLYNASKMLKNNGEIYFFLPHSFLNVATHKNIRKYIFNENFKISIKLLGNAFKGVLSESILLYLKNDSNDNSIVIQDKEGSTYQLPLGNIKSPDFIVSATIKTKDALIIDKIYKTEHITLNGALDNTLNDATIFALGIVTGNNKKYLTEERKPNSEAIFRGKDIEKYVFKEPEYFIEFQPDLYQQVASIDYYRQPKIVYRFISEKIICALDKNNSLILNSANLFISKNYPMETIVAFFNSDIYTFIFKKKFHSRKVLKSHLQSFPLPILLKDVHESIYKIYNKTFIDKEENMSVYQNKIDKIICDIFKISEKQYNYLKGEV